MRAFSLCLVLFALGCGKSAEGPIQTGGTAGAEHGDAGAPSETDGGTGGTSGSSGGTSGGAAGAAAAGGDATGDAGANSGAGANSSAGAGGASTALVDCDPSKVICKQSAPECKFGTAPQVIDGCYGECVTIARCACASAAQCPDPNQYTCWSKTHCGPFVH